MIMRNDTPEFQKDDQNPRNQRREFTWILRAAKPLWQQVFAQPENYIAKGLVFTTDRGIRADLSFNKLRKRLILIIRFRPNNELTRLQRKSIKKVQNERQGLSSIAFDEENGILRISSQSVLPAAVLADAVVPQVFEDAVAVLEDDNLRDIVEQSINY